MQSLGRNLQKLDNATLGDRASAALLAYIRSEKLQPGAGLPSELRLAELLGVSRPVVREALRNLRGLGVIEIFNGRGAVVRELSPASLEVFFSHALQTSDDSPIGLMELRTGLECEAASLAAQRHTPAHAAAMRALVAEMRRVVDDPERYSALDAELHVLIAQATGNELYQHMIGSIRAAMRDASLRGMTLRREHADTAVVQQMHEAIVDHIVAGNADAAFAEMKRHLMAATEVFRHA